MKSSPNLKKNHPILLDLVKFSDGKENLIKSCQNYSICKKTNLSAHLDFSTY